MLRDKTKETALKHVNEVTSFLDDVNSQKNPVANRIKVIMVRSISLADNIINYSLSCTKPAFV